jgi:cob(I)alamin adenosyltransferase
MAKTTSTRRRVAHQVERLADLVKKQVEAGATSVEEVHKSIANLPLDVLERLDVFEKTTKRARKLQETSIGALYDVIRNVNQEVNRLATQLLAGRPKRAARAPARRKAAHKPASAAAP